MPAKLLKHFLDEHHAKYVTITHSPAYTAQEIAASAHISGRDMAKTVMVKIGGRLAMAVLPANRRVVLQDLRDITGYDDVLVAPEVEFKNRFPGCETGAMPPFGNLYEMEVYVASSLAEGTLIAFNAGSHTELIQMDYTDYERLVEPMVMNFTK